METLLDSPIPKNALLYIGTLTTLYVLLRFIRLVSNLLQPSQLRRITQTSSNNKPWAIVTGATAGIGFGFCEELASHNLNLILHGKDLPSIQAASTKLHTLFPSLETRAFVADATLPLSPSSADYFLSLLANLPVTVLINNVGGNAHLPTPFAYLQDRSLEEITATININLTFTTQITALLLPSLLEHSARGTPALILNIGSLAARGMPRLSVYSAAKAYLLSFSRSLALELSMQPAAVAQNLKVQYVAMGETQSENVRVSTSWWVPSSREMARATLARVGGGEEVVTPWLGHWVLEALGGLMPRWVWRMAVIQRVKEMERAWRKEE